MHCTHCGSPNESNAYRCVSCGRVMSRVTEVDGSGYGPATSPLVWSILATLLCCVPFGIVAIVYSSQVSSKNALGQYAEAHKSAASARMWCWLALVFGLITIIISVIVNIAALQSSL